MTLTITNPTQAELLAILKGMNNGQQNIMRQGYNAYVNRRLCFWIKRPATPADVQALMPDYVTEVAPGQFKLTDLGVQLYRAWVNQPLARPDADKQPQGYHGTHHSRNRNLRDMWEAKLPSNGLPALTTTDPAAPEAVETPTAPAVEIETEPVHEPAPVPPTPPQPPTPPTPGIIQLDLTAFIQPLLAEIETLKAQLAIVATPAPTPRPVVRRKSNAAMPMRVQSCRRSVGGAA